MSLFISSTSQPYPRLLINGEAGGEGGGYSLSFLISSLRTANSAIRFRKFLRDDGVIIFKFLSFLRIPLIEPLLKQFTRFFRCDFPICQHRGNFVEAFLLFILCVHFWFALF